MKVMVLAMQQYPSILLTVETTKIYDMRIDRDGISYAVNCKFVDTPPKCPSIKRLDQFYQMHKDKIDMFLTDPSNDNWWVIRNLGGQYEKVTG